MIRNYWFQFRRGRNGWADGESPVRDWDRISTSGWEVHQRSSLDQPRSRRRKINHGPKPTVERSHGWFGHSEIEGLINKVLNSTSVINSNTRDSCKQANSWGKRRIRPFFDLCFHGEGAWRNYSITLYLSSHSSASLRASSTSSRITSTIGSSSITSEKQKRTHWSFTTATCLADNLDFKTWRAVTNNRQ